MEYEINYLNGKFGFRIFNLKDEVELQEALNLSKKLMKDVNDIVKMTIQLSVVNNVEREKAKEQIILIREEFRNQRRKTKQLIKKGKIKVKDVDLDKVVNEIKNENSTRKQVDKLQLVREEFEKRYDFKFDKDKEVTSNNVSSKEELTQLQKEHNSSMTEEQLDEQEIDESKSNDVVEEDMMDGAPEYNGDSNEEASVDTNIEEKKQEEFVIN